jgi:TrmH family RNA methyltransferase
MLHKITSPANPLIKTLKSLHSKKGRAETGMFLAEGARLAEEAGGLGIWPRVLAASEAALARPSARKLIEKAAAHGARCIETRESVLAQISKRDNPQTIVCAYQRFDTSLSALKQTQTSPLWVALERVRDPGNLGAILRTADAAGAAGVILIGETCDPFSVEAVRASMGAIFAIPLAETDLAGFQRWREAGGLKVIGASLNATVRHDVPSAAGPIVLLMGGEQTGLTAEAERLCDALVRIPMRGKADSLNLAAAAAIILYDFWRRRGYDGAVR